MSQEEYKKEQMNLKKMFLLLDIKRKVVHEFSFQKATALDFECMFVFIRLTYQIIAIFFCSHFKLDFVRSILPGNLEHH